jgi:hypothetical protein
MKIEFNVLLFTFTYSLSQKIISFLNMECKENDVNDADIDDRIPADIEKAANRATLTFINK